MVLRELTEVVNLFFFFKKTKLTFIKWANALNIFLQNPWIFNDIYNVDTPSIKKISELTPQYLLEDFLSSSVACGWMQQYAVALPSDPLEVKQ